MKPLTPGKETDLAPRPAVDRRRARLATPDPSAAIAPRLDAALPARAFRSPPALAAEPRASAP